jgi:hypothetical protein
MRKLKHAIAGQIALVLIGCYHYKTRMTRQEREDYEDLKHCAEILNQDNDQQGNYSDYNAKNKELMKVE